MLKSVHHLCIVRDEREFAALTALFRALGLKPGESWQGRRSTGAKFEAKEAGVEIGFGEGFPGADLVIEVDSADAAHKIAVSQNLNIVEPLASCDWGARMFTAELPAAAGRVAIFSYNEDWRHPKPAKGTSSARKRASGALSRGKRRASKEGSRS